MSRLPPQFIEDRALRDAALRVLKADIDHAKVSLAPKGVAKRVGGRIGDGAKDVLEVARVQADDNRGILAMLIGALALFFARGPILEVLGIGQDQAKDDNTASETAEDSDELTDAANEQAAPGDEDEQ